MPKKTTIGKSLGEGEFLTEILHVGLNRLGAVEKWVSCGTLLGLHRDGGFIPSDNDIDVGARGEGLEAGNIADRMFPWKPYRLVVKDGCLYQYAFVADCKVVFDINFYFLENDKLVTNTKRNLRKPAHLFTPLQQWDSPVGKIPAPNDLDAYCEMRYGKSWRTPSKSKGIYHRMRDK